MKSGVPGSKPDHLSVTSYAEVWIEMEIQRKNCFWAYVTSYAEVWIEIRLPVRRCQALICHLLRGGVD